MIDNISAYKYPITVLFFVFVALLLGACKSNNSASQQKTKTLPISRLVGDFKIVQVVDRTDIPSSVTLTFDSTHLRVYGNAACNNYFGSYIEDGNILRIGKLGASRKLCMDDHLMKIEGEVLDALEQTAAYEMVGEQLQLKDSEDEVIIIAEPDVFMPKKDFKLEYETQTMIGVKQVVYAQQKMICIDGDERKQKNLSTVVNRDLEEAFNELSLEEISTYKAPSEERHLDAAPYAKLRVYYDGKTYESQSFDHGNPPAPIARIVNLMTLQDVCGERQ